jgi:antitoxin ParD1/3/4
MATMRKNIVISDAQDSWIKAQIESGQYANYSECIRGLIRREQQRCDSAEAIRSALIAGENSGEPLPFDPEAFKQSMSNMN